MNTIGKLAAALLVTTLITAPPVAAGNPAAPVEAQALDVNRDYRYTGSSAQAAEIHARRLAAGPKGEDLHKLAEDGKYVVDTPADTVELMSDATGADVIDPITFDECDQRHDGADEPHWWFKNKYNICRGTDLEIRYNKLENGQIKHAGSTFFRRVFVGVAQNAENRVKFGLRLIHWYDTGETFKDSPLSFKVGCLNADLNRQSSCAVSPPTAEKTVRQWELDGASGAVWFTATLTTTGVPADKYAAEKRGYFAFDLVSTLVGPIGVPDTGFSPTEHIRCDEATYVSGSRCVFTHVASSLSLFADDPRHGESARFIRDAQTDITSTKPGVVGKKVPGRINEEPLHRLYKDYDTDKDIAGSHRKVRRTCQYYFGVDYTINDAGEVLQCDEYPFATTYENSARVDEGRVLTYAVRPLNALHNETAGQIYGRWLTDDHILDSDPFYVIIRQAAPARSANVRFDQRQAARGR
ncbi:hypothetical protein [Saccharothrix luteola]|uniref:hypothetical protein n=1 Tax=Saccharothrix luteola TaxID=2893018 RepID=UPI001E59225A|nr:hypothetical protein [Saccharothrix luteola]MCC8242764.1 hypothetical protein [Saccharothrix luteola]